MTHALKWFWLVPAFVLLLGGCSHGAKESNRPLPMGPTSLRVENNNWLDVIIYVVHDGQRSRLGSATAAKTTDFSIQPTLLGQLGAIRLIADPVGETKSIASQRVVVKAGTRLVWTLDTDLSRSSLAVY